MANLIWIGALVSLLGVAMLGWCILQALKAKRAGLGEAALKARLQALTGVNMGALAVSAAGLMLVVVGVTFG